MLATVANMNGELFGEGHAAIKTEDILVEPEASVDIRNDQVWCEFRAG